jgi:Phage stabilisation protein
MAYSKTPVVQTYETKRVNFIANPQQRDTSGSKDFRLINMMTEVVNSAIGDQKKYYIKSRPGMTTSYSTNTAVGRGMYNWMVSGTSYIMTVSGNKVYYNGTLVLTLATSTGQVGFTEFVSSTGVVKLVLLDGTNGYVFTAPGTYTQITDTDFPTPHIPHPVFLDGYLFVAKASTQDIYNSNLDDPSLWTAGEFISAEMYPDKIVALSKNNNYIYAIGSNSVEYFYDNANATGSPLARHASAVQQFGTVAPASVIQTEKEVIFVGETGNGGHTVWTIDGFKEKEIGIPAIKSALLGEGNNLANATAFCVRVSGQKCYVICLSTRTLVYSFATEMWHEWATNSSIFTGNYGTDGPNGSAYILDKSSGAVYLMDEMKYTDAGTAITCTAISAKLDFDNMNRKFMHRLTLVGDVPDDTLVDTTVNVSWSDDDYKTWSTPVALKFTGDLPSIFRLGMFRRRAIKLTYALPHLLRLEGMEVDINKGST